MDTQSYIFVRFQKEGVHRYPAAGTEPELADVSFLAHPHRHIFHFEVEIGVNHDDRDIEFIQFKRWLESLFSESVIDIDYKSCEMLAKDLIEKIDEKYPERHGTVTVSEDDENGARVVWYG